MQHHGAPTRLLDVTYSFFVACLFALDVTGPGSNERPAGHGTDHAVLWCIRKGWTLDAARKAVPDIDCRNRDSERTEPSFQRIYLETPTRFVFHENPFTLSRRLVLQQGGFLCPGDVRVDFEENLKALPGWDLEGNVLRLAVSVDPDFRQEAMLELLRMNVSRAVLFPGPDGYAAAVRQRLTLLRMLASEGTGGGA